jgi:hypothetical protein
MKKYLLQRFKTFASLSTLKKQNFILFFWCNYDTIKFSSNTWLFPFFDQFKLGNLDLEIFKVFL